MSKKLNRVALVTGSSKRIGLAIATDFAKLGFDVAIHYNVSKEEALKAAVKISELYGVKCVAYKANLFKSDECTGLVTRVIDDFGSIDALVNNASIFNTSSIASFNVEDFDDNFSLHLKAPILTTQAVYSFAKNRYKPNHSKPCCVINVCDANVVRRSSKYFNYLLSKKALLEATYLMATELAPILRVNAILPGYIIKAEHEDDLYLKSLELKIPIGRSGSVDEICKAVRYLIDNEYSNGQAIYVDGGLNLIS